MNYVCGAFEVKFGGRFRDYSDLDEYVTGSGIEGLLLGEDASDFMAFYAVDVYQPFTGARFRIGMILDNSRDVPVLCPVHGRESLAIGMNSSAHIVNLNDHTTVVGIELHFPFHHFLCNGQVLVAVHELGASVVELWNFQEIANASCDVVAEASLSNDELVLVSMDEETTRIDLSGGRQDSG